MTTVAVVCSPNMGIVDSWLPVVAAVRDQHPDWRVVAVVPRGWGTGIRPESVALRALEPLVDAVHIEVVPGSYRAVEDFAAAKRLQDRFTDLALNALRYDEGLLRRCPAPFAGALRALAPARRVVRVASTVMIGGRRSRLRSLRGSVLVLFDMVVRGRTGVDSLLRRLGDPPTFSLSHGLGYGEGPPRKDLYSGLPATMAYAYSELHRRELIAGHGLPPARVRATGVPRHDPDAPQPEIGPAGEQLGDEWDGGVLLISRPATSDGARPSGPTDWLPAGRKAEQLRAIHRVVCEERGFRLIVTMHPKERDDRAVRDGLPAEERDRTWTVTETHPLALAERLRFAISFSSGVAVDLLSAGVPTVELQDVRGASAFDGPDAVRDAEGRILRTGTRRNGLVLAADDEDDLRSQVGRILTDRDEVLTILGDAYRARYADPRGAVASIVRDIEAHAAGTVPPRSGPDLDH